MKHPNREEWVPYVFGEAEPEKRQELDEHLQQCEQCSSEIAKWQSSLRRMDAWQLPPRRAPRRTGFQPVAWAAAAVLMLGIGLAAGQWNMRATRTSLRFDLAQLEMQIAASKERSPGGFQAKVNVTAQSLETIKALQQAIASMTSEREEDRQALLELIQKLDEKQDAALVSLRKDLETVASQADDQIQAARNRLIELSAVSNPSAEAGHPETE